MNANPADLFVQDIRIQARKLKELADKAMAQVHDEDLTVVLDPESNSIAMIVQHLAGNLRSRWTDFLTSDGEKPDRHRDAEFEAHEGTNRSGLLAAWDQGWGRLFSTLDGLTAEDLGKTVHIRSEPHSVVQAVNRGLTHAAYHVGQIVLLAKHFASADWKTLSIPRKQSQQFNEAMRRRES
ncbi:MAG TPA: DUF1572 family protein [Thermoanaerobaculia bacterium]|nr:DUF1572 family protein [Thermoanaerobaculia bacterium]